MEIADAADPQTVQCPTCSARVQADLLIPAGDTQVCPHCREEYLQRLKEGVSTQHEGEHDLIRQEHIKHEASLKSVGILYYLGAIMLMMGAVFSLVGIGGAGGPSGEGVPFMIGLLVFNLLLGALLIALGRGFRRLKRWVRIPATILSALGLLNIPIGTLINAYILYLIWSKKGSLIFSPEYQEVIASTPHVKYRTPVWIYVLLALLVLGLIAAIAIPAFGVAR